MIDITKPLRFRNEVDDREVRYVGEMPNGRIVFAIQDTSGGWYTTIRHKDGRMESGRDDACDIINVPKKRGAEMIDITKPLQTRDGRKAEVIRGPDGCLYGWAEDMAAVGETVSIWRLPDGRIEPSGNSEHDIINVPERGRQARTTLRRGAGNQKRE